MREVVIVDGVRTAIGSMGGTLKNTEPQELGRVCVEALLKRTGVKPELVDEIIFGHCRQSSDNGNIARLIGLLSGLPEEVPGHTVMRQCASGLTAMNDAWMLLSTGQADVIVAGGVESMSTAPFYIRGARFGLGTGSTELVDSVTEVQFRAQPPEMYGKFNMGMTAENIAAEMNISREDQDKFAYSSQMKCKNAMETGRFKDEIVPVVIPQRKKDPIVFDTDEFPKADTTMEKLASLKPAFKPEGGCVTAGNASGRNDGGSAVLMMTKEKAEELGLKPMAVIRSHAVAGVNPKVMGYGPVPSSQKALQRAGLSFDDIGLVELNEAFAAQSLGCIRKLGIEDKMDIINVNGGAIALGHPVGDSGCRIAVTLLHEMQKRQVRYGLATLCIAGGMGEAMVFELV